MLTVYNTLTGQKELLKTIEPGVVRMYVCGVTVYDYCHIGHARSALVFDVIRRHLEFSGYRVEFVKNFTDVDDKIIKRANEQGVSCDTITAKYIQAYYDDMGKLGIRPATVEPKATEHMVEIIRLTDALMKKGLAYQVDGDVYFEVAKYPAYGRLSKRKAEDLLAGARVEVDERKRHPMDFALWKASKPGEPAWDSPWGAGRPGWHIECSVMSEAHLGKVFDIHGGGLDLIFPHHENEIAQSRCAHGTAVMANYWMHNGFLQVEGQKMSKSLGNFFTIEQLLSERDFGGRKWHGSVLRLAMLTSHYRQPIDWTVDRLEEAQENLVDWISAASNVGNVSRAPEEIVAALADDLNTSEVIAQMHKWCRKFRTGFDMAAAQELGRALRFLGLWTAESAEEISSYDSGITLYEEEQRMAGTVEPLISARIAARKAKDWKESDRIRDALAAMGVAIKDNKDGTTSWELKR